MRLWDYVQGTVKRTYQGHSSQKYAVGACFYTARPSPRQFRHSPKRPSSSPWHNSEDDGDERDLLCYPYGGSTASMIHHRDRIHHSKQKLHDISKSYVLSASENGDIFLWDVKSKEVVQQIVQAHGFEPSPGSRSRKGTFQKEDKVACACLWVDINGDTMVSCGQDMVVRVWRNVNAPRDNNDQFSYNENKKNGKCEDDDEDTVMADTRPPREIRMMGSNPLSVVSQVDPVVKMEES